MNIFFIDDVIDEEPDDEAIILDLELDNMGISSSNSTSSYEPPTMLL